MTPSTLTHKWRSFLKRPRFERAWFAPVWLLLGISRALVLFIPFRHLAGRLGQCRGATAYLPLINLQQQQRARQIAAVIHLTARYTPWTSNCFNQAITARWLLGFYGVPSSLFLGVKREQSSGNLQAHAWVASGKVRVTGGEGFDQFSVVANFINPPLEVSQS